MVDNIFYLYKNMYHLCKVCNNKPIIVRVKGYVFLSLYRVKGKVVFQLLSLFLLHRLVKKCL